MFARNDGVHQHNTRPDIFERNVGADIDTLGPPDFDATLLQSGDPVSITSLIEARWWGRFRHAGLFYRRDHSAADGAGLHRVRIPALAISRV